MNVLIVKYLPSGDSSNTLKLLNHFKKSILNLNHSIEEVDLIKTPPLSHNLATMRAYKVRNFGGQEISNELSEAIEPMDRLTSQFKNADLIVLATPMHNFSLPGIVKVYFDAVMQSGEVFKYEDLQQIGLMNQSRFLTIYTSMGTYLGEYGYMNNLETLLKIELEFMGFEKYDFVHASTGNNMTVDSQLKKAQEKIQEIVKDWL